MLACLKTIHTSIFSSMLQMSGYLSCVSCVRAEYGDMLRGLSSNGSGSGSGGTWTANKIFMLTKIENIPSLPTEGKLIYPCVIHS